MNIKTKSKAFWQKRKNKILEVDKPFKLARSFFAISIIFVFLASLILVGLVTKEAEKIITKRVEDDSIMLMESLSRQMFENFLLPKWEKEQDIHIGDPAQREELNKIVLNTTYGFDLEDVVIYQPNGVAAYSTNNSENIVGTSSENSAVYAEAVLKKKQFEVYRIIFPQLKEISQTQINDRETEIAMLRAQTAHIMEGEGYLVASFFPKGKFTLKSFKAMDRYGYDIGSSGVLELTRDLTPEFKRIGRLQLFGVGFAALISFLLTLILRVIVGRGEAIIKQKNTEREILIEQLNYSERLASLGSMVATVAHEIRNPLGIIHSTADFLTHQTTDSAYVLKLSNIIIEETDRLSEVVTDFLDFARPQTPALEKLFLEDILEEILASLEITLAKNEVEVKMEFLKNSPFIMGDFKMLYRAFLNIFMNAIQVMPEGGLLTVKTEIDKEMQYLQVTVEDTGPGVSEEALEQIFEPFYTTKTKGSGLGLLIVENIVKSHKGGINVVSLNEELEEDEIKSGLKIIIYLPLLLNEV